MNVVVDHNISVKMDEKTKAATEAAKRKSKENTARYHKKRGFQPRFFYLYAMPSRSDLWVFKRAK